MLEKLNTIVKYHVDRNGLADGGKFKEFKDIQEAAEELKDYFYIAGACERGFGANPGKTAPLGGLNRGDGAGNFARCVTSLCALLFQLRSSDRF